MAQGKPSKRKTANQIAWDKELQRVQRYVRQLEKQGLKVPASIIPETPTRITKKDVESIRKLTPKLLSQKVQPIEKQTGKTKTTKIKKPTTKQTTKMPTTTAQQYIPMQSRIVLENVREMIAKWEPQANWSPYFAEVKRRDKNILSNILEGAVNTEGENTVARRMERHAIEIMDIVNRTLYESGGKTGRDQVQIDLQRFSAIIMGRNLTVNESKDITDAVEQMGFEQSDE